MVSTFSTRRAGVPLLVVETSDSTATRAAIIRELNGKAETCPLIFHDLGRGAHPGNGAGITALDLLFESQKCDECEGAGQRYGNDCQACKGAGVLRSWDTLKPSEILAGLNSDKLAQLGNPLYVFLSNPQLYWSNEYIRQLVFNLRDAFKPYGSQLIMLVPPGAAIPAEIKIDCVILSESNPTPDGIGVIIDRIAADAGLSEKIEDKARIVDTLLGYPSEYTIEQAFAMSLTRDGCDIGALWAQRIAAMKAMAGLEISLPSAGYAALAGCEGVKGYLAKYLGGRRRPRIVFWLDEIEKMMGGASGDTSGVSQGLMEKFLGWTEDNKVDGLLLTGIPGAGKSATAKCTAGEAKIPLAHGSMSTVKGSLVGQSESQWNALLNAVASIGQGRVLMIATCNNIDLLAPEVISRFRLGTFFYDYPTDDELAALWGLYMGKYGLTAPLPDVKKWVGREVEAACDRAWLFNCPLSEALETVVPVSMSSAAKIDKLRREASGRFLATSHAGVYQLESIERQKITSAPTGRKIEVE